MITPEYSLMSKSLSAAITLLSPERKRRRQAGLRLTKRQRNCAKLAGHLLLLIKPLYMFFLKALAILPAEKETELRRRAKKPLTSTTDRREDEGEQASTVQTKQLAIKNDEHHA